MKIPSVTEMVFKERSISPTAKSAWGSVTDTPTGLKALILLPAPGYGLVHTAVGKFVKLAPEPVNVRAVTLPLESTVKPVVPTPTWNVASGTVVPIPTEFPTAILISP